MTSPLPLYTPVEFAAQNAFVMAVTDFYLTLLKRSTLLLGEMTATLGDCTITKVANGYEASLIFGPTVYDSTGETVKDTYEKVMALKQADLSGPFKLYIWVKQGSSISALTQARSLNEAYALLSSHNINLDRLKTFSPLVVEANSPFAQIFD